MAGNALNTGTNELELVDFRILKKFGDKVYEGIYGVNVAKVKEIIKAINELYPNMDIDEVLEVQEGEIYDLLTKEEWLDLMADFKYRYKKEFNLAINVDMFLSKILKGVL